ncbi:MAG: Rrf2 family transcriptional regulator [Oscillospiraceae bacterium]|jgi:Rrf2 family protein|nr:Rrf2 family transcriptional regulator [Oscillospiraceae bacterium]
MHINLETDYAVRIVDILAKSRFGGERLSAVEISARTNVPQRFALKILRKLVAGGIAESYRGVCGGYELCREPEDVSIYDVAEITEGKIRFSRCLGEGYDCSCSDELPCAYRRVFGEITDEICDILKKQTFDRLVRQAPCMPGGKSTEKPEAKKQICRKKKQTEKTT